MRFEAATSAAEMLGAVPRWLARPRFAAWSLGTDLVGWVLWSHIGDSDAEEMKQLWLRLAHVIARPYDFVLDLRQLASMSPGAYARIREFAEAPKPGLRRQAILVGEEHPGGMIQVGLYMLKPPAYEWRSFRLYADAAAWLATPAAATALAAVDDETRAGVERTAPLASLRALLAASPGLTLDDAASRLARSSRSLQRCLAELDTTFSDEVDRVRVIRAQDLLREPSLKLDAIALEVGCADRKSLNRLFRRVCGELPAEFRLRLQG